MSLCCKVDTVRRSVRFSSSMSTELKQHVGIDTLLAVPLQDMKKGRRVQVPESEFKDLSDGLKCELTLTTLAHHSHSRDALVCTYRESLAEPYSAP